MIIKNESEMLKLGEKLGQRALKRLGDTSVVFELKGDVGAGKTTLSRGIAQGLGVEEPVTSPSFTISKRYAFPDGTLTHYDFYRLGDPGIMLEDFTEALSIPNSVTIVEWGDSVRGFLPEKHLTIDISYLSADSRDVTITEKGAKL